MLSLKKEKTTANKRFSAMLAEEYVLIVPFAYHLRFGLKDHRISALQKALTVSGQAMTSLNFDEIHIFK